MTEVLALRWRRRRALRLLLSAAEIALDTYDVATAVIHTDGRVEVTEHVHDWNGDTDCVECGLRWPCPMRRLSEAADIARKEI